MTPRSGEREIEFVLVEDNEDDVLLIRESFEDAELPHKLHVCADGQQALDFLRGTASQRGKKPLIVLLDINLPKKSGLEILEELKSDPALSHLPVVMLTTSDRKSDVLRSYRKGACSYITKPADYSEFRRVVEQLAGYWTIVSTPPPPHVAD